jgi:hypothetical protein
MNNNAFITISRSQNSQEFDDPKDEISDSGKLRLKYIYLRTPSPSPIKEKEKESNEWTSSQESQNGDIE